MISPIITQAANLAARIIENELRAQAPSGKIASGVSVVPSYQGSGNEIEVNFDTYLEEEVKYGIYLDSGTLKEKLPNPDGEYNPDPGEGKGGIKPRYWTNIPEESQYRIDLIIDTALETAKEKEAEEKLDKIFDKL
jgi:hypothetical protein